MTAPMLAPFVCRTEKLFKVGYGVQERRKGRVKCRGQSETVSERARNPESTLEEVQIRLHNFTGEGPILFMFYRRAWLCLQRSTFFVVCQSGVPIEKCT